jgi:sortase A
MRAGAVAMVAAGTVAVVTGAWFIIGSLAPMWGPDTSTVTSPPAVSVSTGLARPASESGAAEPAPEGPVDGVAFAIRIPAIAYSATVLEGVDRGVLDRGPGHYPTSAWPGHAGTVGVAAHNVYWLSFNSLKPGDRVEMKTRAAVYLYEITSSKVTGADDPTVLVPTPRHRLALTTCYPLWAGAFATQRLVFFGKQLEATSSAG